MNVAELEVRVLWVMMWATVIAAVWVEISHWLAVTAAAIGWLVTAYLLRKVTP
jgi:hypothetical protein